MIHNYRTKPKNNNADYHYSKGIEIAILLKENKLEVLCGERGDKEADKRIDLKRDKVL